MKIPTLIRHYFPEEKVDRKPVIVLITAALCLTMIHFFSSLASIRPLIDILPEQPARWLEARYLSIIFSPHSLLYELIFWASISCFFYLVVPVFVVRLILREKLRDYGLKMRGMFKGWKIYLLLFAIVYPFVILASYEKGFQLTYPFFSPHSARDVFPALYWWELFYALQFFGLEFFFRGFMIHGTKQRLGIYSIFVMTVPYCMIHFQKPLPEAIGSIVAGVVLGLLSYRTVSIWMGAMIHIAVAITMDLLSLWHRGML